MTWGFCRLHYIEYPLEQGDEVCPLCLKAKEQDIKWRVDDSTTDYYNN